MKRIVFLIAALAVLLACLCSCSVGADASPEAHEAEPYIRQMAEALAAEDIEAAKALMHPNRVDDAAEADIAEMIALLDGREIMDCIQINVNVSARVGTGGSSHTETGTVALTFEDWSDLNVSYIYHCDDAGEGFMTFRFNVGF